MFNNNSHNNNNNNNNNEKYSGWVWISKVKDSNTISSEYNSNNFNKRKKRWLIITETTCYYCHNINKKDMKEINLINLSPLIILGDNDLPTSIYLIDSVERGIYVILEPEDYTNTTILCSILTLVCDNSRIYSIRNSIIEDNSEKLNDILKYCRHSKSLLEDNQFSYIGSALHLTLEKQSMKCLPIILFTLGISSLSIENNEHYLPIHTAILTYNENLIKTFVQLVTTSYNMKSNELLNMSNKYLQTPLHIITDEEIIPLLVQLGANLDAYDVNGYNPLMVACQKKLIYVAIEFMDFGVNINKPSWSNGITSLMLACIPGNDELVKELIDRNADINFVDNYNRTALHYSCMNGHIFGCVLLTNLGINCDIQDIFGATALCYAAASTIKGNQSTSHEIVALLIARGSYPKIRDIYGRQALHYAAECGNDTVLSILLENGSEVNAVDHSGQSALDIIESHLEEFQQRTPTTPNTPTTSNSNTPTRSTLLTKNNSEKSFSLLHALTGGTITELLSENVDENLSLENSISSNFSVSLTSFSIQLGLQGFKWGTSSTINITNENLTNDLTIERYQKCSNILLSNGAGKRIKADIPIETNYRDLTFNYSKNGSYNVSSATNWALFFRITSFRYFSPYYATSYLSTYRLTLLPLQLMNLVKLRFFMLLEMSNEVVNLFDKNKELFEFGVFFMNIKDIYKYLQSNRLVYIPQKLKSQNSNLSHSRIISNNNNNNNNNNAISNQLQNSTINELNTNDKDIHNSTVGYDSTDTNISLSTTTTTSSTTKNVRPISLRVKASSQSLLTTHSDEINSNINITTPIISDRSINYVKGIDSFSKYEEENNTLQLRSVYLGKPVPFNCNNINEETIFEKFLESISLICNSVELYDDKLFILCRNKYCQILNCCVTQEYNSEEDWNIKIFNSELNSNLILNNNNNNNNINENNNNKIEDDEKLLKNIKHSILPDNAYNLSSIELNCHAAPRLMRGKIIIELKVNFVEVDILNSGTEFSFNSLRYLIDYYRDIMNEIFASILSQFVFNKFVIVKQIKSKDESLLSSTLITNSNSNINTNINTNTKSNRISLNLTTISNSLHSIESEYIHQESLPSFCTILKKNEQLYKGLSDKQLIKGINELQSFESFDTNNSIGINNNSSNNINNNNNSNSNSNSNNITTKLSEKSSITKSNSDSISENNSSIINSQDNNSLLSKNLSTKDSNLRCCLQFLTIWCVDFYEDDFENDTELKTEMSQFLQIIMEKCNDLIEDEFDPNSFAPFLQFETNSLFEIMQTISEDKDDEEEDKNQKQEKNQEKNQEENEKNKKQINNQSNDININDITQVKRKSTLVNPKKLSVINNSTNTRVSLVQGSRGSILSKRLTSKPMTAPKKRGTVLLSSFVESEFEHDNLNKSQNIEDINSNSNSKSLIYISNIGQNNDYSHNSHNSTNHRLLTRSSSVEINIRSGNISLDYNILELNFEEITEQITLIQHNIFCRIKRIEFINQKQIIYNNLKKLTEFSIHWMNYITSQILSGSSDIDIINKIHLFIDIIIYMKQINNYFGIFEIITVLESTSIYRLKTIWGQIDSKRIEKYNKIKQLYLSKSNFLNFRQYMKSNNISVPCVPYLGLYQKDFISLNTLPNYNSNGLLNITKFSSIGSKLLELNSYQKIPYHFVEDSHIIHILKSSPRYKTEEEQYQQSLIIEPLSVKK